MSEGIDTEGVSDKLASNEETLKWIGTSLEKVHREHTRSTLGSLVLLGASLFVSGRVVTSLGDTALGDYLSSLVTEVGGAFLIFILLDTIYRSRSERLQSLRDEYAILQRVEVRLTYLDKLKAEMDSMLSQSPPDLSGATSHYTILRLLIVENFLDQATLKETKPPTK